jgi:hypothetical protein
LAGTLAGRALARAAGALRVHGAVWAAWAAFAPVAVAYVWFASVGYWVRWPPTSSYFEMQADAFRKGQLHLDVETDPDLLALANPYDPAQREGTTYVWDTSLFQGRFYLYWGPVPALLLVPLNAAAGAHLGDNALVFLFLTGLALVEMLLLVAIWQDHFSRLPWWTLPVAVAVAGLSNPKPWLMNSPWVYEAAIAGGQFFLLGGLLAALPSFVGGSASPSRLLLAGACWGLALGTRASLLPAIALLVLWVLFVGDRRRGRATMPQRRRALVLIPIAAAVAALGAYNTARFGSPFDLGHRYQLTTINLHDPASPSVSLANLPANLQNYLVNPVRTLPVFPFVKPVWGSGYVWALHAYAPEGYYSRQVSGLLLTAPFVWFAGWGLWEVGRALWPFGRKITNAMPSPPSRMVPLIGVLIALAGLSAAVVTTYVVASMRYLADFAPALFLLASVSFWRLYQAAESAGARRALALTGLGSAAASVAFGLLLGVTSYHARFEVLNPALFERITRWLAW